MKSAKFCVAQILPSIDDQKVDLIGQNLRALNFIKFPFNNFQIGLVQQPNFSVYFYQLSLLITAQLILLQQIVKEQ